jgi:hypothetical protein
VGDCCNILSSSAEFPTDVAAAHLARLHGLTQKVARTFGDEEGFSIADVPTSSINAGVKALEAELVQLRSTLPKEFHNNGKYDACGRDCANYFSYSSDPLPRRQDLPV